MKQIRTTIESPYEPNDNGALWLDTSNPDAPVLKAFTNGKWQATSGTGTEPVESAANKVTEISAESTDVEYPSAKAVYEALESAGEVIEGTWAEIKALRDNSELVPGRLYRITDYVATTSICDTKSANNQFDIIILALTDSSFSEEGWAAHHRGDTYFSNSNLQAWKVWYCIDNDTTRFAWAVSGTLISSNAGGVYSQDDDLLMRQPDYDTDSGEFRYAWGTYWDAVKGDATVLTYTKNEDVKVGDDTYCAEGRGPGQVESVVTGKGVIYRLIDENNNDVGYDFKSILFKRYKVERENFLYDKIAAKYYIDHYDTLFDTALKKHCSWGFGDVYWYDQINTSLELDPGMYVAIDDAAQYDETHIVCRVYPETGRYFYTFNDILANSPYDISTREINVVKNNRIKASNHLSSNIFNCRGAYNNDIKGDCNIIDCNSAKGLDLRGINNTIIDSVEYCTMVQADGEVISHASYCYISNSFNDVVLKSFDTKIYNSEHCYIDILAGNTIAHSALYNIGHTSIRLSSFNVVFGAQDDSLNLDNFEWVSYSQGVQRIWNPADPQGT